MDREVAMTLTANSQNDPGFDEDSPDLEDPGIDPTEAAKVPTEGPDVTPAKRVDDDQYPPFTPER
jgi:hypothetical protein